MAQPKVELSLKNFSRQSTAKTLMFLVLIASIELVTWALDQSPSLHRHPWFLLALQVAEYALAWISLIGILVTAGCALLVLVVNSVRKTVRLLKN